MTDPTPAQAEAVRLAASAWARGQREAAAFVASLAEGGAWFAIVWSPGNWSASWAPDVGAAWRALAERLALALKRRAAVS